MKVFRDSSRILSVAKPHHLIYDHSLMDTQFWDDVLHTTNDEEDDYLDILENFKDRILSIFRLKYNGMSLFHNFAGNYDFPGVIDMVYTQYMKAKDEDLLYPESIKYMPLNLLCKDDFKGMTALEISIACKRPALFEMMIAMLRDFQDICSSKMMLGNIQNMFSLDALDYFDKSQFHPLLL